MCLLKLDPSIKVSRYIGYKVFRVGENGKLRSQFIDTRYIRETGKWLKTESLELIRAGGFEYPMGFHVYLTLRNANFGLEPPEIVKRVRFKGVVVKGWEGDAAIVVCKEIFIEE